MCPADVGGLEQVVASLTASQAAFGVNAHVAAVLDHSAQSGTFAEQLSDLVGFHPIRVASRAYLHERKQVRMLALQLKADVIHTHGYRPDILHGRLNRGTRAASVSTVHGFTGINRCYEYLQCMALRFHDVVVAVSGSLHEQLAERKIKRIQKIQNSWKPRQEFLPRNEARKLLGLSEGQYCAVWIGRLSREKGPDVLVEAITEFSERNRTRDFSVSVIGDGPELDGLKQTSLQRNLNIIWHGQIPHAAKYLNAFDVLLLTSRTEGTPMVLLEAMAAELPIIATSVGGVPDMLADSEAMLISDCDPGAISQGLEEYVNSPMAATQNAMAAIRRFRESFGMEEWVKSYNAAYDVAIQRFRSRSTLTWKQKYATCCTS